MLPTGTVTFLFTDIQGSTPLWERDPERMAEALQAHNLALRTAIESHGGVVFKIVGDEFQTAFPTASQALRAAVAGQRALSAAAWNDLGELSVRMGLHTGEAELDPNGDEYAVSHTKNRVARIMSAAHGGQILLSQEIANLVLRGLPEGVTLKDLGEHQLKGLAFPEQLFQACADGLQVEFPPLAAATSPLHNLPSQLTSFIGREREIGEVVDLVEKNRLVVLVGPGGTGKTRLSLRVAEEVLERFPDGVWFTALAELGDPELLPRAIADSVGLPEISTRSQFDQLQDYLHPKELLIILDNCEHMIADCAKTAETLLQSCPKLKILASSREALRVMGEIIYQVPSLSVPDPLKLPPLERLSDFSAVQLFAERAVAVDPGFVIKRDNAENLAQISHRLDGIPLSIELAAARVNALTVEQIAARLDNRFRLLTSGSRTALPRQQTLRASIDWSYSLLDESERLLLTRLSVFQGGWTLELAGEVCGFDGLDEFDVLDGLSQLVSKSLIQPISRVEGSRRYRQLETIREYAREKLLEFGTSETVRNRHLDAFVQLAEAAELQLRGPHQIEWLDRLEIEWDNLRAALEWSLIEEPQKGLRLATAMFWFWYIRGHRVEGEAWLNKLQARSAGMADVDPALIATARARQSHLQMSIGRLGKDVMQAAGEALAMTESLGDDGKLIRAMALWVLAISKKNLGENIWSHKYGHECLDIAVELGDRFMIAESYEVLIDTESDPDRAWHYAEKHLALRRELGDLDGQIIAHNYMAINEFWLGNLVQARQLCKTAMEIASTVKNQWWLSEGHSLLGYFCLASGEAEAAIEHFQQALTIVQDLREWGRVIRQLNALGCAYATKREWPEAERTIQQAIQKARSHHFTFWEIISCINKAEVACTFDHAELAAASYRAAADVDRSQEHTFLDALITYGNGKAALLRGDLLAAERSFHQALNDAAESGNRKVIKYSLQALALCAFRSGHIERAVHLHGLITSRNWLLWPMDMPWLVPFDLDDLLARARKTLGEDEYARLYAEGQSKTLEQAVAYGLDVKFV